MVKKYVEGARCISKTKRSGKIRKDQEFITTDEAHQKKQCECYCSCVNCWHTVCARCGC